MITQNNIVHIFAGSIVISCLIAGMIIGVPLWEEIHDMSINNTELEGMHPGEILGVWFGMTSGLLAALSFYFGVTLAEKMSKRRQDPPPGDDGCRCDEEEAYL